jgi:hypothetical protein
MRKASWFKTEAKWTAAIQYLLLAAGLAVVLVALVVRWLRAAG